MAVSEKALQKAEARADSYANKLKKLNEKSKEAMQAGLRTGVGMGSAFGMGYIEGRYPDKAKVLGVDLSLLVGVVGTAVGAFEMAGDDQTNSLVEAVGNGALFAFAAKKGGEMGREAQ